MSKLSKESNIKKRNIENCVIIRITCSMYKVKKKNFF